MAYKMLPVAASMFPSPQQTIVNDYLQNVNDMFYVAPNVFTVQEETTRGTGICDKNVDVRITKAVRRRTVPCITVGSVPSGQVRILPVFIGELICPAIWVWIR